jgi:hypothetical protein
MLQMNTCTLSKLKQSEFGSSTSIYPPNGRFNLRVNSPLGILSTIVPLKIGRILETPPRSIVCHVQEVNSPMKFQFYYEWKDCIDVRLPNFALQASHEAINKSTAEYVQTKI